MDSINSRVRTQNSEVDNQLVAGTGFYCITMGANNYGIGSDAVYSGLPLMRPANLGTSQSVLITAWGGGEFVQWNLLL